MYGVYIPHNTHADKIVSIYLKQRNMYIKRHTLMHKWENNLFKILFS